MAKELTNKQKIFCEEYVKNGFNGSKAYQKAYDSDRIVAKAEAWKMLRDPRIREEINRVLLDFDVAALEVGVSKKRVMQVIAEMLEAKRPVYKDGIRIDDVPDWTARNNAVVSYARLIGVAEKKEVKLDDGTDLGDVDLKKLTPEQREELKQAILRKL